MLDGKRERETHRCRRPLPLESQNLLERESSEREKGDKEVRVSRERKGGKVEWEIRS